MSISISSFQTPEAVLKRADTLLEVGNREDSTLLLLEALKHKKFRQAQTNAHKSIAQKVLKIAVEDQEMDIARDALIAYRSLTQQTDAESLGQVTLSGFSRNSYFPYSYFRSPLY